MFLSRRGRRRRLELPPGPESPPPEMSTWDVFVLLRNEALTDAVPVTLVFLLIYIVGRIVESCGR